MIPGKNNTLFFVSKTTLVHVYEKHIAQDRMMGISTGVSLTSDIRKFAMNFGILKTPGSMSS